MRAGGYGARCARPKPHGAPPGEERSTGAPRRTLALSHAALFSLALSIDLEQSSECVVRVRGRRRTPPRRPAPQRWPPTRRRCSYATWRCAHRRGGCSPRGPPPWRRAASAPSARARRGWRGWRRCCGRCWRTGRCVASAAQLALKTTRRRRRRAEIACACALAHAGPQGARGAGGRRGRRDVQEQGAHHAHRQRGGARPTNLLPPVPSLCYLGTVAAYTQRRQYSPLWTRHATQEEFEAEYRRLHPDWSAPFSDVAGLDDGPDLMRPDDPTPSAAKPSSRADEGGAEEEEASEAQSASAAARQLLDGEILADVVRLHGAVYRLLDGGTAPAAAAGLPGAAGAAPGSYLEAERVRADFLHAYQVCEGTSPQRASSGSVHRLHAGLCARGSNGGGWSARVHALLQVGAQLLAVLTPGSGVAVDAAGAAAAEADPAVASALALGGPGGAASSGVISARDLLPDRALDDAALTGHLYRCALAPASCPGHQPAAALGQQDTQSCRTSAQRLPSTLRDRMPAGRASRRRVSPRPPRPPPRSPPPAPAPTPAHPIRARRCWTCGGPAWPSWCCCRSPSAPCRGAWRSYSRSSPTTPSWRSWRVSMSPLHSLLLPWLRADESAAAGEAQLAARRAAGGDGRDACVVRVRAAIASRLLGMPLESPLKTALTGLELLLARAQVRALGLTPRRPC